MEIKVTAISYYTVVTNKWGETFSVYSVLYYKVPPTVAVRAFREEAPGVKYEVHLMEVLEESIPVEERRLW